MPQSAMFEVEEAPRPGARSSEGGGRAAGPRQTNMFAIAAGAVIGMALIAGLIYILNGGGEATPGAEGGGGDGGGGDGGGGEPVVSETACQALKEQFHCTECLNATHCSGCEPTHELVDGFCKFNCGAAQSKGHCLKCTFPYSEACSQCEEGYQISGGACYKTTDCTEAQTEEGCTTCSGEDMCISCETATHQLVITQCQPRCTKEQQAQGCTHCNAKGCTRCAQKYVHANDTDGTGFCSKTTGPAEQRFYIYRAKNANHIRDSSFNAASAAGAMWYVHNEVIAQDVCGECTPGGGCTRKYSIDRIARYKVTVHNTDKVYAERSGQFGPFRQIDSGECTWGKEKNTEDPPYNECKAKTWDKYGYVVGCQPQSIYDHHYHDATWYSFPDKCPSQDHQHRTKQCKEEQPGGRCEEPTGDYNCTYFVDGEVHEEYIKLDDLVGLDQGYSKFCNAGGVEFNKGDESKATIDFWLGKEDPTANAERTHHLLRLFKQKYPEAEELPDPFCDGF
eukprot:TRINITY_DN111338_c0_g1_i1.p2 TRINITY_DN111338_c0_g1~~TRINITY_DN111338_c0_g1_i1.p2  ORF type:complete len:507 (+),score=122.91 TRINITY_DN111338_c0_g1_i1:139-1659(+)